MQRSKAVSRLLAGVLLLFPLGLLAGQTMTRVKEPTPAPDFILEDMEGKRYQLSKLRGKVVFINFWATWCPPCRAEMPSMQRAYEKLRGSRFEMLAINVGEDIETIFGFTVPTTLTFPILLDEEAKAIEKWPVRGLPTTFIVDAQGRVAYTAIGAREWDDPVLIEQIRTLIKAR